MKLRAVGSALIGLLMAGSIRADVITLKPSSDTMVLGGSFHAETPSQYTYVNQFLVANVQDIGDENIASSQGLLTFKLRAGIGPVTGATLKLFEITNGNAGGTFGFNRNTAAWQTATVTWDTRPSYAPAPVASLNVGDGLNQTWRSWDVTSVVNGWLSGKDPNFGLTFSKEGSVYPVVFFGSSLNVVVPEHRGPPPPPEHGMPAPPAAAQVLPPGYYGPELILQTSSVVSTPEPASLAPAGIAAVVIIGISSWTRKRSQPVSASA